MDVKKGTANQGIEVLILDISTGLPIAVDASEAGLAFWYRRDGGAKVALTAVSDLAAVNSAFSAGGIKHIGDGVHRLDVDDGAFAVGSNRVTIGGGGTDVIVVPELVQLVSYDPNDAASLGLTHLTAIKAKTDSLTFTVPNNLDVNMKYSDDEEVDNGEPIEVQLSGDGLAAVEARVWASAARTLTSYGTLVADVAAAVWGFGVRVLTAGTNIVLAKGVGVTGFNDPTAAAVREEMDANSVALAAIYARLGAPVGGSTAADIASVKAIVDAVKAKTDNLPGQPAAVGSAMTLTGGERDAIAAALLDLAAGVENGVTLREAQRLLLAAVVGLVSGAGTDEETFSSADVVDGEVVGTKPRLVVSVDATGNRTAMAVDAA
jgi:hypothetical protein